MLAPERSGTSEIEEDSVHIWYGRRNDELVAVDLLTLSSTELERYEKLKHEGQRLGYATAHIAIRRILSHYVGADPSTIVLGRETCRHCGSNQHGPPRIDVPPTDLNYSVSRSGEWWALGICRGRILGIDIEVVADMDLALTAEVALTRNERAILSRQPTRDGQIEVFYRCWTRKEALLKALGLGIVTDLRSVDVLPDSTPSAVIGYDGEEASSWIVEDVEIPNSISLALARPATAANSRIVVREFPRGIEIFD